MKHITIEELRKRYSNNQFEDVNYTQNEEEFVDATEEEILKATNSITLDDFANYVSEKYNVKL